jgi:hypothetical protein
MEGNAEVNTLKGKIDPTARTHRVVLERRRHIKTTNVKRGRDTRMDEHLREWRSNEDE